MLPRFLKEAASQVVCGLAIYTAAFLHSVMLPVERCNDVPNRNPLQAQTYQATLLTTPRGLPHTASSNMTVMTLKLDDLIKQCVAAREKLGDCDVVVLDPNGAAQSAVATFHSELIGGSEDGVPVFAIVPHCSLPALSLMEQKLRS